MATVPLNQLAGRLIPPGGAAPVLSRRLGRSLEVMAVAGYKDHFFKQTAPDGTPWPGLKYQRPRGGNRALLDTGRLVNSGLAKAGDDEVALSATAPGAALQQFGGTVRPVSAKALAIPVTAEAMRFGPRRFPGPPLVYLPGRKANPDDRGKLAQITFKGRGRKSKAVVTVHYLLRAKVVVPARVFVGFSAATVDDMAGLVAADQARQLSARIGGGT